MPRNQDKKIRVMRTAPCLLMLLAVSFLSVTEAGAQADASRQSDPGAGVKAAAAARRHLERALASDNGNVRWDALRAARSLNEPWIAEIVLPLCDSPDIIVRVLALIPDPSLVGLIEPFLEHDDTDVRTLAAVAIFSILERSGATQP